MKLYRVLGKYVKNALKINHRLYHACYWGSLTEEGKVFVKGTQGDQVENEAVWQVGEKGSAYAQVGKSIPVMPAGEYIHETDANDRVWAKKLKTVSDNLIDLPDLPTEYILNQIKKFWSKKEEYAKYGFLQKRGILLYGPPGCGKSSIIAMLKRQIVELDGVVFGLEDFETLTSGLREFREVEPERPVMTIAEDLETYLEGSNGSNVAKSETAALALYDGENQINNVVHIATTNKPDALADRFIRRPGRFDLVIGLHAPTRNTRKAYLESICKTGLTNEQLNDILDKTKGLSLAYMREIATTFLVLEIPLEETIKRLTKNAKQNFSEREGFSVGFSGGDGKA
jgi:energy-coupling factor transporter ATP-binding protein EcfA2